MRPSAGSCSCSFSGMSAAVFSPPLPQVMKCLRLSFASSGVANMLSVLYLMWRGHAALRNRRANLYALDLIAGMAISAQVAGAIASAWGWRTAFDLAAVVLAVAWLVGSTAVLPDVRRPSLA